MNLSHGMPFHWYITNTKASRISKRQTEAPKACELSSAVYRKRNKRTDYVDNMSILTSNFFEDISHVTKELDYSQITKMYVSNASRCL